MPVTINGSDGITNASWTTGTRPSNPAAGQMGFNTETEVLEFYNASLDEWRPVTFSTLSATGGSVSDIIIGGQTYRVHEFTSTGTSTFEVVDGSGEIECFIVGGGGGTLSTSTAGNSGGGGGGFTLTQTFIASPQTYNVIVGDGGDGDSGESSSFNGTLVANGGFGGSGGDGFDGGSGGGSRGSPVAGSTVPGGDGGSDGTDGESTNNSGGQGQNTTTREFGSPTGVLYSGGGGGGSRDSAAGLGGDGGGGNGGKNALGEDGSPNTGGGAGGIGRNVTGSAKGGSGIVLIRYRIR